jgi:ubiquinol-cytochrome c reductase cytochrome b subunit
VAMVGLFAVSGILGRGRRSQADAVKSGGFFLIVTGVLLVMAAAATINPIWLYGPADPASGSAGASPEWYLAFLDGALRLVPPGWEFVWLGRTWSVAVLLPVIAGSLFFVVVAAYPFIEARFKPDTKFLERPRDNPTRTGIGVAGMTFYGVLWMAASADTIAVRFHLTFEGVLHTLQVLVLLGPVIGFLVTRSLCLALQDREREVAEEGAETGVIIRTADGGYHEIHRPVRPALPREAAKPDQAA